MYYNIVTCIIIKQTTRTRVINIGRGRHKMAYVRRQRGGDRPRSNATTAASVRPAKPLRHNWQRRRRPVEPPASGEHRTVGYRRRNSVAQHTRRGAAAASVPTVTDDRPCGVDGSDGAPLRSPARQDYVVYPIDADGDEGENALITVT